MNRQSWIEKEQQFCDKLFKSGFWVHFMVSSPSGQPADVIAVKFGKATLIDVKECSLGKFDLNRIESNQDMAMAFWGALGNGDCWFALFLDDNFRMVAYSDMVKFSQNKTIMNRNEIYDLSTPLERWIEEYDNS